MTGRRSAELIGAGGLRAAETGWMAAAETRAPDATKPLRGGRRPWMAKGGGGHASVRGRAGRGAPEPRPPRTRSLAGPGAGPDGKGKRMSIIGLVVLGLIAGFIASKIVNKTGEGLVLDIVLGVVGAMVGGWLFAQFGAAGVLVVYHPITVSVV